MWIFGIFFFFASSSFEIKRKKTGENSNTVWKVSVCIELYELIGSFSPSFEAESINIFLCVRCHFVKLSENWSIWLSR